MSTFDTKSWFTDQADDATISVASPMWKITLTWGDALSANKRQGYRMGYQGLRIWEPDGWADIMTPGRWDMSNDLWVKDH